MKDQGNIFTNSVYPLNLIRSSKGMPKLVFKEVEASDIPQPYSTLLVHEGDMTSRLEAYHNDKIKIRKLSSSNDGKAYFREVVLETVGSNKATEYGAIEITLQNVDEELRSLIIEAKKPLGTILNEARVPYSSAPRAFLKVVPDNAIVDVFGSIEADYLFGRSNVISSYSGDTIAQIVEIIPSI